MNYLNLCVSACLAHGDLLQIDQEMSAADRHNPIVFIKHALVTVANLADLVEANSLTFREFPDLSVLYKKLEKKYQFSKYIRNRFVGHTNHVLIETAIEWRPESQPSPHFDAAIAEGKMPAPDTASANFSISGVSRCSGMFGISS
jgi:hypothetical protein